MTNREWLHTLKDKELVEWMLSEPPTSLYIKNENGAWVLEGEPDRLYPRLKTLIEMTTHSTHCLEEWLKEEHYYQQNTITVDEN